MTQSILRKKITPRVGLGAKEGSRGSLARTQEPRGGGGDKDCRHPDDPDGQSGLGRRRLRLDGGSRRRGLGGRGGRGEGGDGRLCDGRRRGRQDGCRRGVEVGVHVCHLGLDQVTGHEDIQHGVRDDETLIGAELGLGLAQVEDIDAIAAQRGRAVGIQAEGGVLVQADGSRSG